MRSLLLLSACLLLLPDPGWAQSAPTTSPASQPRSRGVRILRPEAPSNPGAPVAPENASPVSVKESGAEAEGGNAARPPAIEIQTADVGVAAPARCERAFPSADLAFSSDRGFAASMMKALTAKPDSLVLDVPGFAPEATPAWLAPWLVELQSAGGAVEQRPIPCGPRTRGMSLGKLLKRLFGVAPDANLYSAARGYDAVFWTEKTSAQVTQVQFKRRPG